MTHFRLEAVDLAAVHGGVSSQSPLSTPALEPLAVSRRAIRFARPARAAGDRTTVTTVTFVILQSAASNMPR